MAFRWRCYAPVPVWRWSCPDRYRLKGDVVRQAPAQCPCKGIPRGPERAAWVDAREGAQRNPSTSQEPAQNIIHG